MSNITRSKYRNDYYVAIGRALLENPKLSWQAKGLLAYLLSRPEGWNVRVSHLSHAFPLRRDGVRVVINELIEFGYIARIPTRRNSDGKFIGCFYIFDEFPENVEKHISEIKGTGDGVTGDGVTGPGEGGRLKEKEETNKGIKQIKDSTNNVWSYNYSSSSKPVDDDPIEF